MVVVVVVVVIIIVMQDSTTHKEIDTEIDELESEPCLWTDTHGSGLQVGWRLGDRASVQLAGRTHRHTTLFTYFCIAGQHCTNISRVLHIDNRVLLLLVFVGFFGEIFVLAFFFLPTFRPKQQTRLTITGTVVAIVLFLVSS